MPHEVSHCYPHFAIRSILSCVFCFVKHAALFWYAMDWILVDILVTPILNYFSTFEPLDESNIMLEDEMW